MMVDLGTCWVKAEDVRVIHRLLGHDGEDSGCKVLFVDGECIMRR